MKRFRPLLGNPQRLDELPSGRSTGADVTHLAGTDQIVEGPQRLVHRYVGVEAVHVVQIDAISLEATKALLALCDDGAAADAPAVRVVGVDGHIDLGRDDEGVAVASLVDDITDDRFAPPHGAAVDVSGVEKVDPGVERVVQDCHRFLLRGPVAEHPTAQAQRADHDACTPERAILHRCISH